MTDGPYGETKELFGGTTSSSLVEGGGRRVGPSAALIPGLEGRDPPSRRSTSSRRTRVDPEGARLARATGPALSAARREPDERATMPPPPRARWWRRCGGWNPPASSARSPGTHRDSPRRGCRAGGPRRSPRQLGHAGIPDQPVAWMLSGSVAARHRRVSAAGRGRRRYETARRDLDEATPGADLLFDPDAIDDDVLALCSPRATR